MSAGQLKSISERINRLLDERDGINGDISDIYQEAKSAGYIPKVLRKAIARQRMDADKRSEEDSILEFYEAALDGPTRAVIEELKAGATFDATSEKTGTPRRTVARIAKTVPKEDRNGTNDINPGAGASGTAKPDGQLAPTGDFGPQRPFQGAAGSPSEPTGPADIGEPTSVNVDAAAAPVGGLCIDDQGPGSGTQYDLANLAADVLAPPPKQAAAVVAVLDALTDDDLAFPAFLRRAPEEAA